MSIWKKEKKILQAMWRKRLKTLTKEDIIQSNTAIENIPNWRPAIYSTSEELDTIIEWYFAKVNTNKQHPTITGLALELWIDRQTLLNYDKKDKFMGSIKKARQQILAYTENMLVDKATFTPWQIFYLKNNYKQDYQDKIEIDNKHSGSISLVELSRLANNLDEMDILEWEILSEETLSEDNTPA